MQGVHGGARVGARGMRDARAGARGVRGAEAV